MAEKRKQFTQGKVIDISILLQQVLDKNHLSENMHFQTLSARFGEVVGPLLLPHVSLVEMDKNFLVLKASSAAFKAELFLQKKAIIEKCNNLLGKHVVKGIKFI